MEFVYKAKVNSDPDGGFLVTFPDVPEAITSGATEHQALAMAEDALSVALLGRLEDGDGLPRAENLDADLPSVTIPASVAAKLAVMTAFSASGLTKTEFARRLGVNEKEARRILDPNHNSNLGRMSEAIQVLGGRLIVSAQLELAG